MSRRGFSLIELLIVVAIITLLLQIALPAVEMSREAARRTHCANNLRQLGLAMELHHATHNRFPSGGWSWRWLGEPERGTDIDQPGGWAFNILDFLEQGDLRRMGSGLTGEPRGRAIIDRCKTPIAVFNCPSRRLPRAYRHVQDFSPLVTNDEFRMEIEWDARADYAANGETTREAHPYKDGPSTFAEGDDPNFNWYSDFKFVGIVFPRSRLTYAQVTDGLTYTYMIGEKQINSPEYKSGVFPGDNENLYTGFNNDTCRSALYPPLPDTQTEFNGDLFGSAHPAGWQMTFCDGSARFISYNIDETLHKNLADRSDGNVVALPGAESD